MIRRNIVENGYSKKFEDDGGEALDLTLIFYMKPTKGRDGRLMINEKREDRIRFPNNTPITLYLASLGLADIGKPLVRLEEKEYEGETLAVVA